MLFSIVLFKDSYLNIVTITFSALIIAELLNVYTEVRIDIQNDRLISLKGQQKEKQNFIDLTDWHIQYLCLEHHIHEKLYQCVKN